MHKKKSEWNRIETSFTVPPRQAVIALRRGIPEKRKEKKSNTECTPQNRPVNGVDQTRQMCPGTFTGWGEHVYEQRRPIHHRHFLQHNASIRPSPNAHKCTHTLRGEKGCDNGRGAKRDPVHGRQQQGPDPSFFQSDENLSCSRGCNGLRVVLIASHIQICAAAPGPCVTKPYHHTLQKHVKCSTIPQRL